MTDTATVQTAITEFLRVANEHPNNPINYVTFTAIPGRRWVKIVESKNAGGGGSVHAFVDPINGDLYKPASWAAPAKGVRFNLLIDLAEIEQVFQWTGGYLYKNQ